MSYRVSFNEQSSESQQYAEKRRLRLYDNRISLALLYDHTEEHK